MPRSVQHPLQALADYLPEHSFDEVVAYLQKYNVHLTVTQSRSSILGNYRHAHSDKNHRISVNGDLNKFSFLITLLHELAHLLTFETYKNKVQPHGKEWKNYYAQILSVFLQKEVFPTDIATALNDSLQNMGASTCAEEGLMRVLHRYDAPQSDVFLLEQLTLGECFLAQDGRAFQLGEKRRTRYMCTDMKTKKKYLISGLYKVKRLEGVQ